MIQRGALYITVLLVYACSTPDSDEQQIRQVITTVLEAIEQRDIRGVTEHLDRDFTAQQNMHVAELQMLMLQQFRVSERIRISLSNMHIRVSGQRAEVVLTVQLTGSSHWLSERGSTYHLESLWRKQSEHWRVVRVRWEREE